MHDNSGEAAMAVRRMGVRQDGIDRRVLLGAGGAAVLAMTQTARAEDAKAQPLAPSVPGGKKLSELIADFVTGFDLNAVPPLAVERARLAFTDTLGVMLAGSQEKVAQIACDMANAEGAAPAVSVVGQ